MHNIIISEIGRVARKFNIRLFGDGGLQAAVLLVAGLLSLERAETAYKADLGHFAPYARMQVRRAIARAHVAFDHGVQTEACALLTDLELRDPPDDDTYAEDVAARDHAARVFWIAGAAHISPRMAECLLEQVEELGVVIASERLEALDHEVDAHVARIIGEALSERVS